MRRHSLLSLALLAATLLLAGCARQANTWAADQGGAAKSRVNDSGGYAGKLAAPPEKTHDVDIEANIKAGLSTDSKLDEKGKPKDPHAGHDHADGKCEQDADQPADKHKSEGKPAKEPKGEAAPKPAEPKPSAKATRARDTSGDAAWRKHGKPVVAMQFPAGVVYLEFWPQTAPKTCAGLLGLVRKKFYDGIVVHRVEPGLVMQAGDPQTKSVPLSDPRIGSGGPGFALPAEFSEKPHVRGTLSMARTSDPNSAGSQFFLCLDRCASLDRQYTVFGQVLDKGMAVVDKVKVGDAIEYAWIVNDKPSK